MIQTQPGVQGGFCVRSASNKQTTQGPDVHVKVLSDDINELYTDEIPNQVLNPNIPPLNDRSQPRLNFGIAEIGKTPPRKTLGIANIGKQDLVVSNFTVPDGFSILGSTPSTIHPGETARVTLQFDANNAHGFDAYTLGGAFNFTTNVSSKTNYSFVVWGRVLSAGYFLNVPVAQLYYNGVELKSGDTVDLGYAQLGASTKWRIQIVSRGPRYLETTAQFTSTNFEISLPKTILSGTFPGYGQAGITVLRAGQQASFELTATPVAAGPLEADVMLHFTDPKARFFGLKVKMIASATPPASASFLVNGSAQNLTVKKGDKIDFSWSSQFASNCSIDPEPTRGDTWTGVKGSVQDAGVAKKIGTETYVLKCQPLFGSQPVTVSRSITVVK